MKRFIKRIRFEKIRNNLHFEFFSSILLLLQTLGAGIVFLVGLIEQLITALAEEDTALDIMQRYEQTASIEENDRLRDNVFFSMREIVRATRKHFNPEKSAAALRLDTVFEAFKNAPHMALPAESAALHNLLQQLAVHVNDVELLGLTEYVAKLNEANEQVRMLTAQRESEAAFRAQHRVKEARKRVDVIYTEIIGKLEAVATLEGEAAYNTIFREINARVEEYQTILNREKGKRQRNSDSATE
jgi:hypothetical protein